MGLRFRGILRFAFRKPEVGDWVLAELGAMLFVEGDKLIYDATSGTSTCLIQGPMVIYFDSDGVRKSGGSELISLKGQRKEWNRSDHSTSELGHYFHASGWGRKSINLYLSELTDASRYLCRHRLPR